MKRYIILAVLAVLSMSIVAKEEEHSEFHRRMIIVVDESLVGLNLVGYKIDTTVLVCDHFIWEKFGYLEGMTTTKEVIDGVTHYRFEYENATETFSIHDYNKKFSVTVINGERIYLGSPEDFLDLLNKFGLYDKVVAEYMIF